MCRADEVFDADQVIAGRFAAGVEVLVPGRQVDGDAFASGIAGSFGVAGDVLAGAAIEHIAAFAADEQVVALFAVGRVVAFAALELVGAGSAAQLVGALAGEQDVGPTPAAQDVVAAEPAQDVVAVAGVDGVVLAVAPADVIAHPARREFDDEQTVGVAFGQCCGAAHILVAERERRGGDQLALRVQVFEYDLEAGSGDDIGVGADGPLERCPRRRLVAGVDEHALAQVLARNPEAGRQGGRRVGQRKLDFGQAAGGGEDQVSANLGAVGAAGVPVLGGFAAGEPNLEPAVGQHLLQRGRREVVVGRGLAAVPALDVAQLGFGAGLQARARQFVADQRRLAGIGGLARGRGGGRAGFVGARAGRRGEKVEGLWVGRLEGGKRCAQGLPFALLNGLLRLRGAHGLVELRLQFGHLGLQVLDLRFGAGARIEVVAALGIGRLRFERRRLHAEAAAFDRAQFADALEQLAGAQLAGAESDLEVGLGDREQRALGDEDAQSIVRDDDEVDVDDLHGGDVGGREGERKRGAAVRTRSDFGQLDPRAFGFAFRFGRGGGRWGGHGASDGK